VLILRVLQTILDANRIRQEVTRRCTVVTTKYDVIIVGGGLGGIACAALLAKWGLKPLVLEKNERTGGKAITISAKGFKYELWPIGLAPSRGHAFESLFRKLGIESELKLVEPKTVATAYRGRSEKWSINVTVIDPQQPIDPSGMLEQWGLNSEEQELAMRVLTDIYTLPPEKVNALDEATFQQFLAQYEVPRPVHSWLSCFCNTALAEPIDLVSASEYIRMQQDIAVNLGGSYPVGGLGRVADVITQAIKANGGEVRTRARVEKITVNEGRVASVVTKDGEFQAPIVVSDAGIQPTVLKLVGEKHFDQSYVNYVKDLVPGWGFTGQRYFLSKPVLQFDQCSVYTDDSSLDMERFLKVKAGQMPEDLSIWGIVTSNYDPQMAPKGKQILLAGTVCSPNPEATEIKMLWDKVDETLFKLWPEMVPVVEAKEYAGPAEVSALTRDHVLPGQGGEAVGMGQIVGQCGRYKPSPKSPIRGLFYVGCDAGGVFMGTHQATNSGINVAGMVLQYHRMRQAMA
jgi:phytoene dehydrogenase-like protein